MTVRSARRFETKALLLRSVALGESDLVLTLLTPNDGKVGALAKGARASRRRFVGALEPFHTLSVELGDRGTPLMSLHEASLVRIRSGLATRLESVEAGGLALRWARHVFPPSVAEPRGWQLIVDLLDALDAGADPSTEIVAAGFGLLAVVGYSLDLECCVACSKPCPASRAAAVDARRGGLVCRACGGGPRVLRLDTLRAGRAIARGEPREPLSKSNTTELLALVHEALAVLTGYVA